MPVFPITIDATPLMYRFFLVPGVTPALVSSRQPQVLQLQPGTYAFQVTSGALADFVFTVTDDGRVQYDPAFGSFLGGSGTNELVVRGFDITIDASRLSGADPDRPTETGVLLANTPLTNEDWITKRTVRLVPMKAIQVQQSSGRVASFSFNVERDGTVSYDARFDAASGGFLQGRGSTTLTMLGYSFVIDASAYSDCTLLNVLPVWSFRPMNGRVAPVVLLPATQFFLQFNNSGVSTISFNLEVDGTVTFDPSESEVLSFGPVAGTPTLTVADHKEFRSPIFGDMLVSGTLFRKWRALVGERTSAGQPVQDFLGLPIEQRVPVGEQPGKILQRFERGMLFQQAPDLAFTVYGEIYSRYHGLGELQGILGEPRSDEQPNGAGGRVSMFSGGDIHWRPDLGAWSIQGAIRERWLGLGGPAGLLGHPTSNELPVLKAGQQLGRLSRFEVKPRGGGPDTVATLYWSPPTGAWEVYGAILTEYQLQGGPTGPLGFPAGAPQPTPNRGGSVQQFQNGLIVWYPDTGAQTVLPPLVLNLFSYAVNDDDFNVQINIFASSGESNRGRMPADGKFRQGTTYFPPLPLLQVNTLAPDSFIRIDQMEAIHERIFEDDRKGDITKTFDINNVWGLQEPQRTFSNAQFIASFAVQPLNQPLAPNVPFRQQLFWPFRNFDTEDFSWQQFQDTFSDVAAVDRHIKFFPPEMHLLEIAYYELFYRHLGRGGNCFGMCLESIYAREHRSAVAIEPIFTENTYRKDGNPLDPVKNPGDVDPAYAINIKHGYQHGKDFAKWFIGKWIAGALHDPVRAFRESRDAFARGDWPMLTVSNGNKFSQQDAHVVVPYQWDPSTEEQIAAQPLSGQTWTIYVANPNAPAIPGAPPGGTAADDPMNKIVIRPFEQTFSFQYEEPPTAPWTGSNDSGGRLLTIPYSVLTGQPQSPTDLLEFLLTGNVLLLFGSDGGSAQLRDHRGRTFLAEAPDGPRVLNRDPVTALGNLVPLLPHQLAVGAPEAYLWLPDEAVPASQLVHSTLPVLGYDWSFHSGTFSGRFIQSSTVPSSDSFIIDSIRTPQQTVTLQVDPKGPAKPLAITLSGWSGSDVSQNRWFELTNVQAQPGHVLSFQVMNAGQTLTLQNNGPEVSFELKLRAGMDNQAAATRPAMTLPAGKAWRIRPFSWSPNELTATPWFIEEMDKIGGTVSRTLRV